MLLPGRFAFIEERPQAFLALSADADTRNRGFGVTTQTGGQFAGADLDTGLIERERAALFDAAPLSADGQPVALDTGLDPVAALGLKLRLLAGGHACVVFATAIGEEPGPNPAAVLARAAARVADQWSR